ncbi:hypothetical protein [Rhizobium leguminosarum]|uniref:hypothetical protein n=1 Tax=Rhizobium leguminosarum TaxID=384 RepID=UPI003F9C6F2C
MLLELSLNGISVVKADIDAPKIKALLGSALRSFSIPKSVPMTVDQARELLTRVHERSAVFLRRIAENNGYATWSEMQSIFGYKGTNWNDFSNSHNRGINTALGSILKTPGCKLVHWDDDETEWKDKTWADGRVYIDGEALKSLRLVFGLGHQ